MPFFRLTRPKPPPLFGPLVTPSSPCHYLIIPCRHYQCHLYRPSQTSLLRDIRNLKGTFCYHSYRIFIRPLRLRRIIKPWRCPRLLRDRQKDRCALNRRPRSIETTRQIPLRAWITSPTGARGILRSKNLRQTIDLIEIRCRWRIT